MKSVVTILILGITLTVIGCSKAQKKSIPSSSIEGAEVEYVTGEILVKFRKGTTKGGIEKINERFGVVVVKILGEPEVYYWSISENPTVLELVKKYQNFPEIEYVPPNYITRVTLPEKGEW